MDSGTGGLDGDPKAKDQVEAIEQITGWRGLFSAITIVIRIGLGVLPTRQKE